MKWSKNDAGDDIIVKCLSLNTRISSRVLEIASKTSRSIES